MKISRTTSFYVKLLLMMFIGFLIPTVIFGIWVDSVYWKLGACAVSLGFVLISLLTYKLRLQVKDLAERLNITEDEAWEM